MRTGRALLILAALGGPPARAATSECPELLTRDLNCNAVDAADELPVDLTDPDCAAQIDPSTGQPYPTADAWYDYAGYGCTFAVSAYDVDEDGFSDGQLQIPDGAPYPDILADLACDNCPDIANARQEDLDCDDVGDPCDNCLETPNNDQIDDDLDLIGSACDLCPFVPDPEQLDGDGDGAGDVCDVCPTLFDDQTDTDFDYVGDACDLCPFVPDPDQLDGDEDGLGDLCDRCPDDFDPDSPDGDMDLVPDACDTCPAISDPTQVDTDGDGLGNACDVCALVADPGQEDQDADGAGDACDLCPALADDQLDRDLDGVGDACDLCPDLEDPDQADLDGDGLGDPCDPCPELSVPTPDGDGDGLGDACDPALRGGGRVRSGCDTGASGPMGAALAVLALLAVSSRRRGLVAAAILALVGAAWPTTASAQMTQVMLESGPFVMSVDGAGSITDAVTELTITRPTAGSRVHRVYATVSSIWGGGDPGRSCLEVDGIPLDLSQRASAQSVISRYDDVTGQLGAHLDTLPVGPNIVRVRDSRPLTSNDGNGLIVIWEDPAFEESSVSVSLGTVLTGTNPALTLQTEPMDTGAVGFHVELGIGISYSASPMQGAQVSELDVNGTMVVTDAGGFDDGAYVNGALYTLGGDGDGPDAERYDVTSLVNNGDAALDIELFGRTQDDFLFALWVWAAGTTLECGAADADADGVPDRCDDCPGEDDRLDTDADGVPDGCDRCPGIAERPWLDSDADGTPDDCDPCPTGDDSLDTDGDGVPNACDSCPDGGNGLDADYDGVPDDCDLCPTGDDALDADADTVPDACDLCPAGDDAEDYDGDGFPDACDVCPYGNDAFDDDGDGFPNGCDWCPGGDDGLDADGDGVADDCDVCPAGPDRADRDEDGVPNACDACPNANDYADADGDGTADACDPCPGTDDDGDGAPDACVVVEYLSPKRGPMDGGVETTVLGRGFDPECVALFDGVPAPTSFLRRTALTATPVAHAAGLVDVTVRCPYAEATLVGGYTFHEEDASSALAPEAVRVLPNQVDPAGGATVTVEGSGFTFGTSATVDGVPVEVLVLDATLLSFQTPAHAEGIADLTVTNPDGLTDTLSGALFYLAPPPDAPAPGEPPGEEDAAPAEQGQAAGCATAPARGLGLLPVVALLVARTRRRPLALLLAALGCSETGLRHPEEPEVPPATTGVPPIAVTGPSLRTTRDTPVDLDGSGSLDPDQDPPALSFAWTITSSPEGATATVTGADAIPTFRADLLGTYEVALVVTDADGLASTNPAAQVVEVVPWEDLELSLSWERPVDLDLHLVAPGGAYYGPDDCFFGNPQPDWGLAIADGDDPWLSTDDDGAGTAPGETIGLTEPIEGTYTVIAVYWNDRGDPGRVDAELEVRGAGKVLGTSSLTLGAVGDAVVLGTLDWSTLAWTADGTATTHEALGGPPFNE